LRKLNHHQPQSSTVVTDGFSEVGSGTWLTGDADHIKRRKEVLFKV